MLDLPPNTICAYSNGLLYSSQSNSARYAGVLPYSSSTAMQSIARVVPPSKPFVHKETSMFFTFTSSAVESFSCPFANT